MSFLRQLSVALLLAVVLASAPGLARAQPASPDPPVPPPGTLLDLGGWRLHLHCTGIADDSRPTVILDAGAGGFSVDWSLVQPEVARFTRVCSYDRAGHGWSDLGPHPRTMRQMVWELRTLLDRADVQPPYVLVGHSYGGMLARLFAFTYPSDVVGIVLDESLHESGIRVQRGSVVSRLVDTATGAAVPAVKTSDPLRVADVPPAVRGRLDAAARQMPAHANRPPFDKLPADAQRARVWAFGQVKHWAANDNPYEAEEVAALLARWRDTPHALGDTPLIVLSRGLAPPPGPPGAPTEEEHSRDQAELATLSRAGKHIIAPRSGHAILLDEPAVVIAAIREIVYGTGR